MKKYSDSQHFEASVANGSKAKYLNNDNNPEDEDATSVLSDERIAANNIEIEQLETNLVEEAKNRSNNKNGKKNIHLLTSY